MIAIENLSFRYRMDLPHVLNGIDLNIAEGERVLVAGKNGAGKTTLSRIISGLIPRVESGFVEGNYLFRGQPISGYSPRDLVREVAVLFQDFEAQMVSTVVREELVFYPLNTGTPYSEALDHARHLCMDFRMENMIEREINSLSGGEKQKIALLSLLSQSPSLLILDEPFTDIDPASQESIMGFLSKGGYCGGMMLFDQSLEYHDYFDRIIIMKDGKILYDGNSEIVADRGLLFQAGLEAYGIFKVIDSGYIEKREDIIEHIRQTRVFDSDAFQTIVSSPQPAATSIIDVVSLSFAYPKNRNDTLKHICLQIEQGDFITVLGANGSGKTTLMKLVAGILDIQDGDILYHGRSLKKFPVIGKVGYVYQNPDHQIFAETVYDEAAFILRMRRTAEDQIQEKVHSVLLLMGLLDKKEADPFSLSKGDRQKLACASIIVGEPDVIILDEPTTGLDYPSLKGLMGSLEELNGQGKTIIVITHSMETAANYGNRIMVLDQGEVIYYGDKRPLFCDPDLMEKGRMRQTEIMEISLLLNGRLLLNEKEFSRCWPDR